MGGFKALPTQAVKKLKMFSNFWVSKGGMAMKKMLPCLSGIGWIAFVIGQTHIPLYIKLMLLSFARVSP